MQRGEAARPKTPLRLYLSLAHICPFVSTTTLRPLHVTCLIILVSRNYTGHGVTGSKTHRLKICQCYSSMKNGLKINSRASSGQVTLESDSNNVLGYHSSKFTPCFSNTWLFFCWFFFLTDRMDYVSRVTWVFAIWFSSKFAVADSKSSTRQHISEPWRVVIISGAGVLTQVRVNMYSTYRCHAVCHVACMEDVANIKSRIPNCIWNPW